MISHHKNLSPTSKESFKIHNDKTNNCSQKPDAKYKITDVSLEYEIVTQPDLTRRIAMEYQSMVYSRILRDRQIPVGKSDTTWS